MLTINELRNLLVFVRKKASFGQDVEAVAWEAKLHQCIEQYEQQTEKWGDYDDKTE